MNLLFTVKVSKEDLKNLRLETLRTLLRAWDTSPSVNEGEPEEIQE